MRTPGARPMEHAVLLLMIFGAFVLGGCGSAPLNTREAGVRSVGVISVAAGTLTQRNIGVTVFGNERATVDVAA